MSHVYSAADLLAFELFASSGREKEKLKLSVWPAHLRSLKCLEGEKFETIDSLGSLSVIFT